MKATKVFQSLVLAGACTLLPGCGAATSPALTGSDKPVSTGPSLSFAWGPVKEELAAVPSLKQTYAPESRAARLREDLLTERNDGPRQKDWVMRSPGHDKGPTVFGLGLKFDLSDGSYSMHAGAVRRGTNRTYGPQLIWAFDKK